MPACYNACADPEVLLRSPQRHTLEIGPIAKMIVSVSRRTDIPAFYSKWFLNRVRLGWCLVPNPFNPNQVSRVPLSTGEVEALFSGAAILAR